MLLSPHWRLLAAAAQRKEATIPGCTVGPLFSRVRFFRNIQDPPPRSILKIVPLYIMRAMSYQGRVLLLIGGGDERLTRQSLKIAMCD